MQNDTISDEETHLCPPEFSWQFFAIDNVNKIFNESIPKADLQTLAPRL